MALPIANSNGAAALAANGNYCAISSWEPIAGQQGTGQFSCTLITNVSYFIQNATATGTITFQEQGSDGTWRNMVAPAAITLSNANFNGAVAGAFHGVRMVLSALAVSTVTYAELKGTVVTF